MDYLLFNEQDILERVDEYALYCKYLQFQPLIGGKYPSPDGIRFSTHLNKDHDPSFGIYERKYGHGAHEFMWKDQASGVHGDIFELVRYIYQYRDRRSAILKIMADFGLGGDKTDEPVQVEIPERKYADPVDIQVKSRPCFSPNDIAYWRQFNITVPILNRFLCTSLQCYWIAASQTIPSYPKGLGYAYRIYNKYQLYFPFADKKHKFRNNYTETCVPGYSQLKFASDTCIITKSTKDIMCLDSFGYEAVAPRGENVLLPAAFLTFLKTKYQRILVLFDNDMKHKGNEYEFEKIYVPKMVEGDKDPTDFCKNHGSQACAEMLGSIIGA